MPHVIVTYLNHLLTAIYTIEEFLSEIKDFNSYKSNKLIRKAVERELITIGEAVNKILKFDDTTNIEDARRIVNLRNKIIHGYDQIDDILVWGILNKDVPLLKSQIQRLLDEQASDE